MHALNFPPIPAPISLDTVEVELLPPRRSGQFPPRETCQSTAGRPPKQRHKGPYDQGGANERQHGSSIRGKWFRGLKNVRKEWGGWNATLGAVPIKAEFGCQ